MVEIQYDERANSFERNLAFEKNGGCVQGCFESAPFLDSRSEAEPSNLPAASCAQTHLLPITHQTHLRPPFWNGKAPYSIALLMIWPQIGVELRTLERSQPAVAAVRAPANCCHIQLIKHMWRADDCTSFQFSTISRFALWQGSDISQNLKYPVQRCSCVAFFLPLM